MSEPPVAALAGLIVLDVSSFIAAPAAAVALADFGADVIKIEPPGEGDPHRHNYRNASYPAERQELPLAARRPPEALDGARPQERQARGPCSSG